MRLYLRVLAILFLSACGGGTGSTPQERPAGDIVGTVFNAAVSGATVRAYSFAAGAKGALLGEAFTDPSGAFGISVNTPSGLVLLESTGGVYREEAGGKDVTVPSDIPMRSIVQYTTGVALDTSISFYTGLATGLAEHLIGAGRAPAEAVAEAFGGFSSAMGLDIRGTAPVDITQAGNPTTTVTPPHEYGFFAAAVSRWSADAGATSVAFLKVAHEDIRTDGKLDGKAGDTTLKVGSTTLDVDAYRHDLALALLRIANSTANKTGLTASQLMPTAKRWNDSTSAIFGPGAIKPINPVGPTLSGLSPEAGATLSGTFTAAVTVFDTDGVVQVEFFIDDASAGTAADPSNPSVQINSAAYADGPHTLRATARNSAGGSSSRSHTVQFKNLVPPPPPPPPEPPPPEPPPPVDGLPPIVSIHEPSSGAIWKRNQTARGEVSDNVAVASATFLLDGSDLGNDGSPTMPRVAINTRRFPNGTYTLVLRAADPSGNVASASRELVFLNVGGGDDDD